MKPSGASEDFSKVTREAILDAAEKVFAEKGFHGATVSEIFELAGANRGLLTYYFKSKNGLFEETLVRRQARFREIFEVAVAELLAGSNGAPSLFGICRMYIDFLFKLAYDSGEGWHNYLKLLANSNAVYDEEFISRLLVGFRFVLDRATELLRLAMPAATDESIHRCLLYLEACTSTLLVSDRLVSDRIRRTGPLHASDLTDDLARFFSRAIAVHCT